MKLFELNLQDRGPRDREIKHFAELYKNEGGREPTDIKRFMTFVQMKSGMSPGEVEKLFAEYFHEWYQTEYEDKRGKYSFSDFLYKVLQLPDTLSRSLYRAARKFNLVTDSIDDVLDNAISKYSGVLTKSLDEKKKKKRRKKSRRKIAGVYGGGGYPNFVGDGTGSDGGGVGESYEIDEKAPPGQESWIKKNKERFIDRYGKEKGTEILYAKAWKMHNESINESPFLKQRGGDHEVSMARSQLEAIIRDASELLLMLEDMDDSDNLKAWKQSLITKASDYIGKVKDRMQSAQDQGKFPMLSARESVMVEKAIQGHNVNFAESELYSRLLDHYADDIPDGADAELWMLDQFDGGVLEELMTKQRQVLPSASKINGGKVGTRNPRNNARAQEKRKESARKSGGNSRKRAKNTRNVAIEVEKDVNLGIMDK